MALASTCPHCRTSFRVVADQLKLHRGLVRCSCCGSTFSGIDHLRYIDDAQLPATQPMPATERQSGADECSGGIDDECAADQHDPDEHEPAPEAREQGFLPDPFPAGGEEITGVPVPDDENAESEVPHPDSDPASIDPSALAQDSAIDYFSTRRARGFADRQSLFAALAAVALAATLAGQWVVAQRSWIAVHVPVAAPFLEAVFAPFGITVGAPERLDALTIESFELRTASVPDLLEMHALLRNRADHPVRWPTMQLTLTSPTGGPQRRRSLEPADYLADDPAMAEGQLPAAIPAHTEWPLHLALRARDLQLSGYDYQVRLYYHR